MIVRCAWCKMIRAEDGTWARGTPPPSVEVSHTACPACAEKANRDLDKLVAGKPSIGKKRGEART